MSAGAVDLNTIREGDGSRSAITQLKNYQFRLGLLHDVIEPDGESIVLAHIEIVCPHCARPYHEFVEVPKEHSATLWGLIGKQVNISKLFDEHYVAEVDSSCNH